MAAKTTPIPPAADFAVAVDFLEQVFARARTTKHVASLKRWIDPDVNDRELVAARDSIISDVIQRSPVTMYGLSAKRAYYRRQVNAFVPVVGNAAREWTVTHLSRQTQTIFQLLITTKPRVKELHTAARVVRATVDADTFVAPEMSSDEAREATGETRAGERRTAGTIGGRLRRLFYIQVLRDGLTVGSQPRRDPVHVQVATFQQLRSLMVHPRGVEMVDAFAKSSEAGWTFTSQLFSESLESIVELQGKLATEPDLVWRFPPAIAAGVASLGLKNRPGITQFALAWGASRKNPVERGLEIAGNALFVLDLVGGPLGGAVSDVLGFVLAVIETAVSFLHDVEQDQAAASTAFAARAERLSQGSNKLGTALQAVAAIAAGLAVPGALQKVVGHRTTEVVHVFGPTDRVVPSRADPRGISSNSALRDAATDLERTTGRTTTAGRDAEIAAARKPGGEYGRVGRADELDDVLEMKTRASVPPPTRAERATTYKAAYDNVTDEIVELLVTKDGLSVGEARNTAARLRKALPENLPRTQGGLRQTIKDLMQAATDQAGREGLTNIGSKALGNRAHRYSEYLLDLLNLQLANSRMKIGVFAEQFRAPRKRGRWIDSETKSGWLGLDAVIYDEGKVAFGMDLKTGRSWSRGEMEPILQRFGMTIADLEQVHPKL